MRDPKRLVLGFLLLIAATYNVCAQTAVPNCDEIKVDVTTIHPTSGLSNGSIDLVFEKPTTNYKIFLLNAGSDKTGKQEVESGKVTNLKAGFFDFLIMDKNRKGCVKQITVVLK